MNIIEITQFLSGTELSINNHKPYIMDARSQLVLNAENETQLELDITFRNFDVEYTINHIASGDHIPASETEELPAYAVDEIIRGALYHMRDAIEPASRQDDFQQRMNDIAKNL